MTEPSLRFLQTLVVATVVVGCASPVEEAPAGCASDTDCDDALSCTADRCDADLGVCVFAASVPAPDAPVPLAPVREASGFVVLGWAPVALADGEAPTYDVVVDGSCGGLGLESCAMESPEIEARDIPGSEWLVDAAFPAGTAFRVRACHPCTGECGPWSAGAAI